MKTNPKKSPAPRAKTVSAASTSPRPIAILVEDNYEDLELQYPRLRLLEAGHAVVIVGPGRGRYEGKHGYPQKEDATFDQLDASAFGGVVVPGGWAPDRLRRSSKVLEFVREMDRAGKLVASICHGPWVFASARILRGREVTSVSAIRDDLVNAGAKWIDRDAVVDRNLVTARVPDVLPAFLRAMLGVLGARA